MELVSRDLEEAAELLAQTSLALDGDSSVLLPASSAEPDLRLLRLHQEAVGVAVDGQSALVRAAVAAAERLLGLPVGPEAPEDLEPDSLEGVVHRVVREEPEGPRFDVDW
jgi:hypothetical protein